MSRQQHVPLFHERVRSGRALIGAGAGTGLSAKCAEEAGVDFIVIYNAGRFRMAGRGSMAGMMPYGNANDIVVEMSAEVLPVVRRTPVLAGVCATDPFKNIPLFLGQLKELGFAGVQNFPSVCLLDGSVRADLEATGYGFDKEVEMVRTAREMDLITAAYVRTEQEAYDMAAAGADIVVAHVGLTTAGMIGARSPMSLADAAARTREIRDEAKSAREDVLVVCHGGPIATPDDAQEVLRLVPGAAGFLGASSMERLPAETALVDTMRRFTEVSVEPLADGPHEKEVMA
ncbi:phosphoenolpyruvate hydrolase family protein [Actinomadura luteofluorescens]|uniref:Putative TIM-barrel enzyme n=1 Tax=Actinomadura luteofluorescens TaxID=46163 RepID=A0A7Y9ERR6_9ACTN|nr:phosphoenolpyruvate hydrolase family protein [Actinomadura luteofluorescens]NYD51920.1 putative TIM-barrel enzyme [Actinomadura luteofluorescens]